MYNGLDQSWQYHDNVYILLRDNAFILSMAMENNIIYECSHLYTYSILFPRRYMYIYTYKIILFFKIYIPLKNHIFLLT